jgi:hypothetical protein
MQNKVVFYEYNIESPRDNEVLFPGICVVHLFNQLKLMENIAIKFVAGITSPNNGNQIINTFSSRKDIEFICNEQYGGMIFRFVDAVKTNIKLLPLLQLDSIGTQYITLLKPLKSNFLSANWNISERKLIQNDLAKFVCTINQDRTIQLFFNKKHYDMKELAKKLNHWEQSICTITGMSYMEKRIVNRLGTPRFINITLY